MYALLMEKLRGIPKRRHEGNIRMDLRKEGDVNRWMELAQVYV
jgi:hypothetical protein